MTHTVLLDTGPLVAFLNARDRHHAWAAKMWSDLPVPLVSCEAVVSEAIFLLKGSARAQSAVLQLIERGAIQIEAPLAELPGDIRKIMEKYETLPTSLADSTLVVLADLHPQSSVLTLDSDFLVYRLSSGRAIEVLLPTV